MDLRKATQKDIDDLMARFHSDDYRRFEELSPIEKILVGNGCGGKNSFINPPDFVFKRPCNEHDCKYTYGGDESWRNYSDKEFYKETRDEIKLGNYGVFKKAYYEFWAFTYHAEVRFRGAKYFNFKTGARL